MPGIALACAFAILPSTTHADPATVQNDKFWLDTDRNLLASQGGGVFKFGAKWYWYGVRYTGAATYYADPSNPVKNAVFQSITCYSSTDLVNWKFEGDVLTKSTPNAQITDTTWIGRMGVAYSRNTKKYVLVTQYQRGPHGDGELFATSDAPTGPFKFERVQNAITNITTGLTGDQTLFVDDDGKAYLCASNHSGRGTTYIAPLRESDYLNVEPATQVFRSTKISGSVDGQVGDGKGREGNCMFRYRGRYYIAASDLHGWNASHAYYITATNILGPYSQEMLMGGTDEDFSHVSQTGLFFRVDGMKDTTVVFAGDRWSDFAGNGLGYNQWCPLSFQGSAPVFHSLSEWTMDAVTGSWQVGHGNNWVLNPSFEADRISTATMAGWTSGSSVAMANINEKDRARTGNFCHRYAAASGCTADLVQSIANLPAGTYQLSAWVQSSGGQNSASIFIRDFGGAEKTVSVSAASGSWKKVSIPGIAATSGKASLGLRTDAKAGNWIKSDDWELVRTDATEVVRAKTGTRIAVASAKAVLAGVVLTVPGDAPVVEVFDLSGNFLERIRLEGGRLDLRDHGFGGGLYLVRVLE